MRPLPLSILTLLGFVAVTFSSTAWSQTNQSPFASIKVESSNLGYDWNARHLEKCQEVRKLHPQILFVGDSITHAFVGRLWNEFYERHRAVNLGFSADRIENILWRLQNGELDGTSPKLVIVLAGTNNLETHEDLEIVRGLGVLCQTIHEKLPKAKILLLGILPREASDGIIRKRIVHINSLLASGPPSPETIYLDIGKAFFETDGTISRTVLKDFLHPSTKGYEILVNSIEPTIKKLLE